MKTETTDGKESLEEVSSNKFDRSVYKNTEEKWGEEGVCDKK